MKVLVLSNDSEDEIENELLDFVRDEFPDCELWDHFQQSFWPENKKKTIKRFNQLKTGDVIITQTVFKDYQQLELMTDILYTLKTKKQIIDLYILHPCLDVAFNEYLEKLESDITQNTDEYNNDYKLRRKYKLSRNRLFVETLNYHNINWVTLHGKFIQPIKCFIIGDALCM